MGKIMVFAIALVLVVIPTSSMAKPLQKQSVLTWTGDISQSTGVESAEDQLKNWRSEHPLAEVTIVKITTTCNGGSVQYCGRYKFIMFLFYNEDVQNTENLEFRLKPEIDHLHK